MASPRLDIISIGTLARNLLWNESSSVRTQHATTTLIRSGKRLILVDPGLPAPAIAARLNERTGLLPQQIDTVFLTSFHPGQRAGLEAFPRARVLLNEPELLAARERSDGPDLRILQAAHPAPDRLADGVDLFPLPGPTPGHSGLLVSGAVMTILIAGSAVPTQDHFLAGQTLPDACDIAAARESLQEVYEIADLIVPGFDNVFPNPRIHGI